MRELKFRVYDKKERCYSDKPFSIDQLGICYIQDEDQYWEEIDEERFIVEPCTGLKDKNGKEIYEGDIVKMPEWYTKSSTEIVYYYKAGFDPFQEGCMGCLSPIGEEVEVVGNIHENGDLLK